MSCAYLISFNKGVLWLNPIGHETSFKHHELYKLFSNEAMYHCLEGLEKHLFFGELQPLLIHR